MLTLQRRSTLALLVLLLCGRASWALSVQERTAAARQTAEPHAACRVVQPFYWEIGDKEAALASAPVGGKRYQADTEMPIASASKWLFGAYVLQLRGGQLSQADINALTMRAGYTNFGPLSCARLLPARRAAETVAACFQSANPKGGKNGDFQSAAAGKFFYNGGHFQKLALDLGLGGLNHAALQQAMQAQLGSDFTFSFNAPQLAGGVSTTPAQYAIFLRKILSGRLLIANYLGSHAVCTNPRYCAEALSTPVPNEFQWQYSLGHWVETDPAQGDGAFSSPGALGFYPWIDSGKRYYGIVARKGSLGNGVDSALCGAAIRKAWMRGAVE